MGTKVVQWQGRQEIWQQHQGWGASKEEVDGEGGKGNSGGNGKGNKEGNGISNESGG
jgi:hypothetical protein